MKAENISLIVICFLTSMVLSACGSTDVKGKELINSNFTIQEINFEPIKQGKNVVYVNARNKSDKKQIFAIHIYTRSPDYGKNGVGWGTRFTDTFEANEVKQLRFVYNIQGPVTVNTWLNLTFVNPESTEYRKDEKPFFEKKYSSKELKQHQENSIFKEVSKEKFDQIAKTFETIQNFIKDKEYEQAWQLFTDDYKKAEFQGLDIERFTKVMEPSKIIETAFHWEKQELLKLKPISACEKNSQYVLTSTTDNQTWTIDFAEQNGKLKIDWIAGNTPLILKWQDWESRLLETMQKLSTKHFDIYYFKDSTAEKEIDKIAREKEKGFQEICQFLKKDPDLRIRIVFFEDEQTKLRETGHQGRGWVYGNTIVEIYNEKEKLDPYHETVHIMMGDYGNPPALFSEGFAVYMSELLGAKSLEYLSGGNSSIYERARELKNKNEWIELSELITYNEIGSHESRPFIAYPEAASFVKFLIENYGKEKFLQSYKQLKNTNKKKVLEENVKKLSRIYGTSFSELERQWQKTLNP